MTGESVFAPPVEERLGWETKDRQPGRPPFVTGAAACWLRSGTPPLPTPLGVCAAPAPSVLVGRRPVSQPLVLALLGSWGLTVLTLYYLVDPVVLLLLMGGLCAAVLYPVQRARQAQAQAPPIDAASRRTMRRSAAIGRRLSALLVRNHIPSWRSVDVLMPVRPSEPVCQPAAGDAPDEVSNGPADETACCTSAKTSPLPADLKPFLNPVEIYLA